MMEPVFSSFPCPTPPLFSRVKLHSPQGSVQDSQKPSAPWCWHKGTVCLLVACMAAKKEGRGRARGPVALLGALELRPSSQTLSRA